MVPGPPPHTLAGFLPRLGGAVIDGVLLAIVSWVLRLLVGPDLFALGLPPPLSWLFGDSLVGALVNAAYFTFFHATAAGQTVGNRLLGLRVVDLRDGGPIPWQRALARWAVSHVSALVIGIGYLWMLWDPRRQTWHDMVAGTLVVQDRYYPARPGSFGSLPR